MKISLSGVWDDTARMIRANAALLAAVAGVFLFLPAIASGYLAPEPTGGRQGVSIAAILAHTAANWPLFLIVNLIGFVGNLALLILVLDEERPTVGGAIRMAFLLLPAYFLASLLSGFMIVAGLFLLIVPGLYLMGRLAPMGPVIVAENRRNPIDVIRRSFDVTKGHGWAILSLILIVVITFWVASIAATLVFGSAFLLLDRAAGGGIGAMLLLILNAAIGATFNTVLMVLLASLYRRLAGPAPTTGI